MIQNFLGITWPGYGGANPVTMKRMQKLAAKAEKRGWFKTIGSLVFRVRHIPIALLPGIRDYQAAKRVTGKGYFVQGIERLILLLQHRFEPREYYLMGFYEAERFRRAGEFISFRQLVNLLAYIEQNTHIDLVMDKESYAQHCVTHDLPCPRHIGVWDPAIHETPAFLDELHEQATEGGVVFKPVRGGCGENVGVLTWSEQGLWTINFGNNINTEMEWHVVRKMLAGIGRPVLFQERLKNHSQLDRFGSLCIHSVRLVTARSGGDVLPIMAAFKIGAPDSVVDNFSYGGIAAGVELENGSLGKGTVLCTEIPPKSISQIGPDKVSIEAFKLPSWRQVLAVGIDMHRSLPETLLFLGHDIALTESGPILIESNPSWGSQVVQKATDVGLGCTHIVELLIHAMSGHKEH